MMFFKLKRGVILWAGKPGSAAAHTYMHCASAKLQSPSGVWSVARTGGIFQYRIRRQKRRNDKGPPRARREARPPGRSPDSSCMHVHASMIRIRRLTPETPAFQIRGPVDRLLAGTRPFAEPASVFAPHCTCGNDHPYANKVFFTRRSPSFYLLMKIYSTIPCLRYFPFRVLRTRHPRDIFTFSRGCSSVG